MVRIALALLLLPCLAPAAFASEEPAPPPEAPPAEAAPSEEPIVVPQTPPAVAQAAEGEPDWMPRFTFGGAYRISAEGLSDMRVDGEGRNYGQNELVSHRLRWEPSVALGKSLTVNAEVQFFSGFLHYDAVDPRFCSANGPCLDAGGSVNAEAENFGPPRSRDGAAFASAGEYTRELALRKLYLTWTTPIGQLRVGRQSSHWGLGILANGGDDERQDWGTPRFGQDRNYGDIVDRVLFVTAPLAALGDDDAPDAPGTVSWKRRWLVALGGDVVVRDERTFRDQGDLALQAIGAVRYAHEDTVVGVYVAHRDLRDRNQDRLSATAFDVHGELHWPIGDVDLYGAAELAWVLGETTLARNTAFSSVTIQQLGWVARVGATYTPLSLGGDVEIGYASGDSNPNDEFLRNFSFDPDYNPSLIMFDQMRAAETVAAAANASDPERVGQPPSAARLLPTGGSVTNAVYVRPTVRYRWEDLSARFAFLWAIAEEDIVDPYNSNAFGGGGAINYQGGPGTQRDLGFELDLGVDYTYRFEDYLELEGGMQGGYFIPGAGFAADDGTLPPAVGMILGRLTFRWLPPPKAPAPVRAPEPVEPTDPPPPDPMQRDTTAS